MSPVSEPTQQRLPSDPAELEREIAARREHLAATIDELVVRAHPKEIARRAQADARTKLHDATYLPDGTLRTERVAAVAGAVVLLLVLAVWRRRKG